MKLVTALFKNRGQTRLYIAFLGVLILALGLSWLYLQNQAAFGGLNLPLISNETTPMTNTTNWKQFNAAEGLTILYPPDWFLVDNKYVSQYSFTPGQLGNNIYNVISAQLVSGQVQASYVNEDWFNRLYNAKKDELVINEFRPSDQSRFTKVDQGKTVNGDRFVLFIDQRLPDQMHAYLIIPNVKMYTFSLDHYDSVGLTRFKQIISTSSITQ